MYFLIQDLPRRRLFPFALSGPICFFPVFSSTKKEGLVHTKPGLSRNSSSRRNKKERDGIFGGYGPPGYLRLWPQTGAGHVKRSLSCRMPQIGGSVLTDRDRGPPVPFCHGRCSGEARLCRRRPEARRFALVGTGDAKIRGFFGVSLGSPRAAWLLGNILNFCIL